MVFDFPLPRYTQVQNHPPPSDTCPYIWFRKFLNFQLFFKHCRRYNHDNKLTVKSFLKCMILFRTSSFVSTNYREEENIACIQLKFEICSSRFENKVRYNFLLMNIFLFFFRKIVSEKCKVQFIDRHPGFQKQPTKVQTYKFVLMIFIFIFLFYLFIYLFFFFHILKKKM